MAKGQVRSNREAKKPKKEKPKVAGSPPRSRRLRLRPRRNSGKNSAPAALKPETIRLAH